MVQGSYARTFAHNQHISEALKKYANHRTKSHRVHLAIANRRPEHCKKISESKLGPRNPNYTTGISSIKRNPLLPKSCQICGSQQNLDIRTW